MSRHTLFDWSTTVKPLLAASYGNLNPQDLAKLARSVVSSSEELLNHDAEYESFYSAFAALAVHYLSVNCATVQRPQLATVVAASEVLARYLLSRLEKHHEHCAIAQKVLLLLLKSLCKGIGFLQRSDIITLTALMKSSQLPPHVRSTLSIGAEKNADSSTDGSFPNPDSSGAPRRSTAIVSQRYDPVASVLDCLISPSAYVDFVSVDKKEGKTTSETTFREYFVEKNLSNLFRLNAGLVLLKMCANLPFLADNYQHWSALMNGGVAFPVTQAEAKNLQQRFSVLLNELVIVSRVVGLPLLEPLDAERIDMLSNLATGSLLAGLRAAVAQRMLYSDSVVGSQEFKEFDGLANNIIEKCLLIFGTIVSTMEQSKQAGNLHALNCRTLGAWCLLLGIEQFLALGSERNLLLAGLGNHAVSILSPLLQELRVVLVETASVDLINVHSTNVTAWQRYLFLCEKVPFLNVLCKLFYYSFDQAITMSSEQLSGSYEPASAEQDAQQPASSVTAQETSGKANECSGFVSAGDDAQSADSSAVGSDLEAEPLLGTWLEEVLSSVPQLVESALRERAYGRTTSVRQRTTTTDSLPPFLTDKSEVQAFLNLSCNVVHMIADHLMNGANEHVNAMLRKSIGQEEVKMFAQIFCTLDSYADAHPTDNTFAEFSAAFGKLVHNMIVNQILSESLENALLMGLNVALNAENEDWPLNLSCRTLTVLGEVLLLRQHRGRDEFYRSESELLIVQIWQRLLRSLQKAMSAEHFAFDQDLNVEHVQLLVFLFHSLQLMQKKAVLLAVAQQIIAIGNSFKSCTGCISSALARMLLMFEYLLRYFYEPPSCLVDQVRANIFPVQTYLTQSQTTEKGKAAGNTTSMRLYCPCPEVEDVYRARTSSSVQPKLRPFFYNIGPTEGSTQEVPKLDGLALSFIQGSLNYSELYATCVSFLGVMSDVGISTSLDNLQAAIMQYTWNVVWRLTSVLPPSAEFCERWETCSLQDVASHELLHILRISPRFSHSAFTGWIKDALVKQGVPAQKSESSLMAVATRCNTTQFVVSAVEVQLKSMLANKRCVDPCKTLTKQTCPSFWDSMLLDVLISRLHCLLDTVQEEHIPAIDDSVILSLSASSVDELGVPAVQVMQLFECYIAYARCLLLDEAYLTTDVDPLPNAPGARGSLMRVMAISSGHPLKVSGLGLVVWSYMQPSVKQAHEQWSKLNMKEYPSIYSWKNEYATSILPAESVINGCYAAHLAALAGGLRASVLTSVKHTMLDMYHLLQDIIRWYPGALELSEISRVFNTVMLDVTMDNLSELACVALESLFGPNESDEFMLRVYRAVLVQCYELIIAPSAKESCLDERILHECLKFMETLIEKPAGRRALEDVLTISGDIGKLWTSGAKAHVSSTFAVRSLRFFGKLFTTLESNSNDPHLNTLASSLVRPMILNDDVLQVWFARLGVVGAQQNDESNPILETRVFLISLANYIAKQPSAAGLEVAGTLLTTLIPVVGQLLLSSQLVTSGSIATKESSGIVDAQEPVETVFCQMFYVLTCLASVGNGSGHATLFKQCSDWLDSCGIYLQEDNVLQKMELGVTQGSHQAVLEAATCLLTYCTEVVRLYGPTSTHADEAVACGGVADNDSDQGTLDADSDWLEEMSGPAEDDESGDESDSDDLNTKLCSFTITQKEFMNQHWYHCHTCGMVDGEGVCTVCAKVCHKDHDLSYSKYGSFFCDCGAKQDTCLAITGRTVDKSDSGNALHARGGSAFEAASTASTSAPSLRQAFKRAFDKADSSPTATKTGKTAARGTRSSPARLTRSMEGCKDVLYPDVLATRAQIVQRITSLQACIIPAVSAAAERASFVGQSGSFRDACAVLRSADKHCEFSDNLVTPALGSQENAFENVKLQLSGEQGQTIRQLLNAHVIHRRALASLENSQRKRQLVVCHDKGKISILHLSALLKQADSASAKKKLTLHKITSETMPFTVLSVAENPMNNDYLAVTGLKECQVLVLSAQGQVSERVILPLQLDAGNFVAKVIWLPCSQTELALVTADFVRIYNLSKSVQTPDYHFVIPMGKIRDATVACWERMENDKKTLDRYLMLISSVGYVYCEKLAPTCCFALHGPFFITSMIYLNHPDLKTSDEQIAGGGISIYYSHCLQMAFVSYQQGKTFMFPMSGPMDHCDTLFPICWKSTHNGGGKAVQNSALVRWCESPNTPGLLSTMTLTNQVPVVFMVKPDSVLMQEVKLIPPSKTKVVDCIPIRHVSSTFETRTSLFMVCEDGSLRIHVVNGDLTSAWIRRTSCVFPPPVAFVRVARRKNAPRSVKQPGVPHFAVDFFEHCEQLNDVEFGGRDMLHVYNVQQLKNRLNTCNQYIACAKSGGFQLEVTCNENNKVICGIRVELGKQSLEKSPSSIELFGRSRQVVLSRARWYDVPLTREESIQANGKLTILFGQSHDPSGISFVDSVKVYGKTQQNFGWSDDVDDLTVTAAAVPATEKASDKPLLSRNAWTAGDGNQPQTSTCAVVKAPSSSERLIASAFGAMEAYFAAFANLKDAQRVAKDLAFSLLTSSCHSTVLQKAKSVLLALSQSKTDYHAQKDKRLLAYVIERLHKVKPDEFCDPELFCLMVAIVRGIAVARPQNLVALTGSSKNENEKFLEQLMQVFWSIQNRVPAFDDVASVCAPSFNNQLEGLIRALVRILYSFALADITVLPIVTKIYTILLFSKDVLVASACKQALNLVLRPKQKQRHVHMSSAYRDASSDRASVQDDPDTEPSRDDHSLIVPAPPPPPVVPPSIEPNPEDNDEDEPHHEEPLYEIINHDDVNAQQIEELLASAAGHMEEAEAVFDLPPDADDDAMVEIAIALSLQEQGHGGAAHAAHILQQLEEEVHEDEEEEEENEEEADQEPEGYQAIVEAPPASDEPGQFSDTTQSGSDDEEGSTAATEGSTLRMSPAPEPADAPRADGSASESGASAHGSASGRSSTFGDTVGQVARIEPASTSTTVSMSTRPINHETEVAAAMHHTEKQKAQKLNVALLRQMLEFMPNIRQLDGVRVIPYMQVIYTLTSDVNPDDEGDRETMRAVSDALLKELEMKSDLDWLANRSPAGEVHLMVLRLLSLLLARSRTKGRLQSDMFVSCSLAAVAAQRGLLDMFLSTLNCLLPSVKRRSTDFERATSPKLLSPRAAMPVPDVTGFFQREYVKEHSADLFEQYLDLLTEISLRIPYQIKKISDGNPLICPCPSFGQRWHWVLCEYLLLEPTTSAVRREARKLMMRICGGKDKYRQLKDGHALRSHLTQVRAVFTINASATDSFDASCDVTVPLYLDHATLTSMMEHMKSCTEVSSSRTLNWQNFCLEEPGALIFLIRFACAIEDASLKMQALNLISAALCAPHEPRRKEKEHRSSAPPTGGHNEHESRSQRFNGKHAHELVAAVLNKASASLLTTFIQHFLLLSNASNQRWLAHGILAALFKSSNADQRLWLLDIFWDKLWPAVPNHGRRAAQFADLMGYFTLQASLNEQQMREYSMKILSLLKTQNEKLSTHPNSQIYGALSQLLDSDGYYLEDNPCLVCNNPEIGFANLKLSSIKADSRFSTNTQIVKLVSSHEISRITLKISDIKRTKMVKRVHLYYSNKMVPSVVELKNKPEVWSRPRRFALTQGLTDLRMDFPLPIVACNLMFEYVEFYETATASSDTVQCPRCSASVPASPGVCGNCGENCYQCAKCRSINYDEKDPFLCNACGFSKYAKFDYTLTCRPCATVDPIQNEEDRKKALNTINTLLEKADAVYHQLLQHRPQIEACLAKLNGQEVALPRDDSAPPPAGAVVHTAAPAVATAAVTPVNRAIQQLAMKYSRDCRSQFDELSKIFQKILACRMELVQYDRRQHEGVDSALENLLMVKQVPLATHTNNGRCYGCTVASVEHCILLLRALATHQPTRQMLAAHQEIVSQLFNLNLREGPSKLCGQVRELLFVLTKDLPQPTENLNALIYGRVSSTMKGSYLIGNVASQVSHELELLNMTIRKSDRCWEKRVQCAFKLFIESLETPRPGVREAVTLPCLRMIHWLIVPPTPTSAKNKEKSIPQLASVQIHDTVGELAVMRWITGQVTQEFDRWRTLHLKTSHVKGRECNDTARDLYLMEKFGKRWLGRALKGRQKVLPSPSWVIQALFCPSSAQMRQAVSALLKHLCATAPMRRAAVLDLLTPYLEQLTSLDEVASEFVSLYVSLLDADHWKFYVSVRGLPARLGTLIVRESDRLNALEDASLASSLSNGFAVKVLSDVLLRLFTVESIRKRGKARVLGAVLHAYLNLKRLLVQRTKLVDEAQAKLLELLEQLTSGTERETEEFMQICVQTVKKLPQSDMKTPVFVFERLCSIIFPEEKEVGEFLLTIEKDPAQEDFLQGRMAGNPYSSADPGMGPLMRDVKNRICRDCDLITLLEDDTGMELLVNNKIVALDLPVADVYRRIWEPTHAGEAMMIVYRMRGLLGDATEEFVQSLDAKKDDNANEEETYRRAGVMCNGGGLEVMVERLGACRNAAHGQALICVLLKLFEYCVKLRKNRQKLLEPTVGAVKTMLTTLEMILRSAAQDADLQGLAERLLRIADTLVIEAAKLPMAKFKEFAAQMGKASDVRWLLDRIHDPMMASNGNLREAFLKLLPNLTLGDDGRMNCLVEHFKPFIDFNRYDYEATPMRTIELDTFCTIAKTIVEGPHGGELKAKMADAKFVVEATEYLSMHCPELFKIGVTIDSPEWKEFLAKPALKYVLKMLTGLCQAFEPAQLLVAEDTIPVIHRLEQVSSEEHLGTLAENLMEVLRKNPRVEKKIEEVRDETKATKKRMAQKMREKQLLLLNMKANEKGQVRVQPDVLQQHLHSDLHEESGLVCSICRDGYKFQPQKVLGIYTYTKRVNSDDFEPRARKQQSYSTVTHFNIVHVDCHEKAVRSQRGREEWESALLHNANTRCNGLLPLWGPQVPESSFANCLVRHNTYIQESTGHTDVNFQSAVHDLKLLLLKFAQEQSFSQDTGGGGRDSNVQLVPHLMFLALYVLNTTKSYANEEKLLRSFYEMSPERSLEMALEPEGTLYCATLTSVLLSRADWGAKRLALLRQLVVTAHARAVSPTAVLKKLEDRNPKAYSVYKPYLMFFVLVDGLYGHVFKEVPQVASTEWPKALSEYIRENGAALTDSCSRLLQFYESEALPCESFDEFCDVMGLLEQIPDPEGFLRECLQALP